jgi:acyl-CoA thioester hydrolase
VDDAAVSRRVKQDSRFSFPFRVRFSETDAQGIVFNGSYFTYVDTAITEYQRMLGFTWHETLRQGFDFVVAKVTFDFLLPTYFDDVIMVFIRTTRVRETSLDIAAEIYRDDPEELLTTAGVVHVSVNPQTKKPISVPEVYRRRVVEFEGLHS